MISNDDDKRVFMTYPECFLTNVTTMLNHGTITIDMYFIPKSLEEMLNLTMWAIGSSDELHNASLRTNFVVCLANFIPSKKR